MMDSVYSLNRSRIATLAIGVVAAAAVALFAWQMSTADAAGTVLVRGIVKPGGSSDSVNLYITHVASAPDATAIRGIRTDVDLDGARIYKWQETKGSLEKVRTTSVPTPEKEIVVKGTLLDDNRIKASWVVQNYREFTLEGVFQGRDLDLNKTDEGYVTVNITKSIFRGITPERPFKEALIEGKDLRIRINGSTSVTALGESKTLEEVNGNGQKVRIEGQLNDELVWVASKFNELNE